MILKMLLWCVSSARGIKSEEFMSMDLMKLF